jgi:hypothetical protein
VGIPGGGGAAGHVDGVRRPHGEGEREIVWIFSPPGARGSLQRERLRMARDFKEILRRFYGESLERVCVAGYPPGEGCTSPVRERDS